MQRKKGISTGKEKEEVGKWKNIKGLIVKDDRRRT